MPPEITYFEKMIKSSRSARRRSLKTARDTMQTRKSSQQQVNYLREDLQYALVMTNRNSNALVDILSKVSKTEKQLFRKSKPTPSESTFEEKLMKTKRSQTLQLNSQNR